MKVKHHKGKDLKRPQIWVFGMYERPLNEKDPKKCLFIPVPKRDAFNLLNIIYKHVNPGTLIISDCWAAYNDIRKLDKSFEHQTVNHSLNFVDPETLAHTNSIESVWNSGKIQFKTMRGVSRKFLNSYLTEFMWRRNYTNDRFGACEAIVDAIAHEFPLESDCNFDEIEKLEIENDSQNCLDVEDIGSVKLALPMYSSETDDDNEVDYDNADVVIESVAKGDDISESSQSSFISSQISNNCEANDDNSNSASKIFNFFSRSLDLNSFTEDDNEFQKIVENKLTVFLNNNDSSLEFPTELNKTQRSIVHAACEKYNLQHISQGFSPNRKIIVSKIGTILGKKTTQKEISADLAKISIPKIPNNQHVTDILNAKALTPKRTPKKRGRKPIS